MSQWFVARDGKQQGPVSQDGLLQAIRKGKVKTSDMVWNDTMPSWVTAGEVPELADAFAEPSAAPATAVATVAAPNESASPAAPANDDQWFYATNGQQQGPVSADDLRQWISANQLPADTMVWREGMGEWTPAHQLQLFAVEGAAFATGAPAVSGPLQYYTPQPGQAQYVGFWWRLLAYIIDYFVLLIPSIAISVGFEFAQQNAGSPDARLFLAVFNFVASTCLTWLYFALMESSAKQGTLGKMACGFAVVNANGQRISFLHATGRYFSKIVSAIILCVGFMMIGWTERKQGLHDIMAGTFVVKKRP